VEPPSVCRKAEPPSVSQRAEPPSVGRIIFKVKPPSVGRIIFKAKPPSVGRIIFKAKPPSVGQIIFKAKPQAWVSVNINSGYEELYFIAWCRRHNVERGLLPTPSYRERGREESMSLLRVEAVQLRSVPRVLLVHPCFGIA
jgi:hypothetical protein